MKFLLVMIGVVGGGMLASAATGQCVGDCDGNGEVTINELIIGVNIALGNAALDDCPSFDADGNGEVTINELIIAVNNALQGCPDNGPTQTPTEPLTPAPTEPLTPTPTEPLTPAPTEPPTLTPTEPPTLTPTEPPTPTPTDTPVPTPTATEGTTFSSVDVVIAQASGECGTSRDGSGTVLKNLSCGLTYVGGGGSSAPAVDASPLNCRFAVTGCTGSICTLGPTSAEQAAPKDCTDADCPIGVPVPVNSLVPTCTETRWGAPGEGSIDVSEGKVSFVLNSSAHTWLTSDGNNPCPRCVEGTCTGGARKGQACTSTDPNGLTNDCLPGSESQDIGFINLAVTFTAESQTVTSTDGVFCEGQDEPRPGLPGCFGARSCRKIEVTAVPAAGGFLPAGSSHAVTLAVVACVPASGDGLVDATSDLPGPAAEGVPYIITLNP